jgi:hypothetical protein
VTRVARADKLMSIASEISDVEVDAESLAFMGQALVQTTLPHTDPGVSSFERTSGAVSLSIIADPKIGLPFGTVPRLVLAWICTEAVKTKCPRLDLGRSQKEFLHKLGMRTDGRDGQRLREQSMKLFSSVLSIVFQRQGRFCLQNMAIADEAFFFWDPERPDDQRRWKSTLKLSGAFFRNITESPVPIDMRVLHALSQSPLAMDIYSWLVYRIFVLRVTRHPSTLIPWQALKRQFGADYSDTPRGLLDFKKRFLQRLEETLLFYPEADVTAEKTGAPRGSQPLTYSSYRRGSVVFAVGLIIRHPFDRNTLLRRALLRVVPVAQPIGKVRDGRTWQGSSLTEQHVLTTLCRPLQSSCVPPTPRLHSMRSAASTRTNR